jgi:hypothetical protein
MEVFALLVRGITGQETNLPEFAAIIPYLGLYTLVPLHPETLENIAIPTLHSPSLSIIQNNRFIPAPANMSPIVPHVARIFDALSLPNAALVTPGLVPLSPSMPGFEEQRYWRLPVKQGVILELLIQRAALLPGNNCAEVRLARAIYSVLTLQIMGLDTGDKGLGPSGPSGSGGAGGDNHGNPRQKRKRDEDDPTPPQVPRRGSCFCRYYEHNINRQ